MNFSDVLEKRAKEYPDKSAIIFRDAAITFRQLKNVSFQIASGLARQGLVKSDKVAIFLPNLPEYIYSFLGIFLLRGISVPLDFMLTEEEVINFINHSESKILIAQSKKGVDFKNIQNKCSSLKQIIIFGESQDIASSPRYFLPWHELLKEESLLPKMALSEKDHSSIFYTSGSTGHPKGVLLSYGHLNNPIETLDYFLHPTHDDSFLCAGVPARSIYQCCV